MQIAVDGRRFRVVSDADGPRIIYERVTLNKGHPWLETVADKVRWHRNHQKKAAPKKLIAEVLRLFKEREND